MALHQKQQPLVILTRPAGTSAQLIATLTERGFHSMECPLFRVDPVDDRQPVQKVWAHWEQYSLVIFVSPNAIHYAWSDQSVDPFAIESKKSNHKTETFWPTAVPIAVMGPGSRAALERYGIYSPLYQVITPEDAEKGGQTPNSPMHYDSEALAATLERTIGWPALRTRPVLIVRGNQGRDWLMHYLQANGVQVESLSVYKYQHLAPSATQWSTIRHLLEETDYQHAQYWVITSSTSMRDLDTLACAELSADQYRRFKHIPMVTTQPRVARCAQTLGFNTQIKPYLYGESIIRALQAYHCPDFSF